MAERGEQPGGLPRAFVMYRRHALASHADHAPAFGPHFEGVVFSDGRVAVRWLTAHRSVAVWDSLGEMLAVHGHAEYGSELVWLDVEQAQMETGARVVVVDGSRGGCYVGSGAIDGAGREER